MESVIVPLFSLILGTLIGGVAKAVQDRYATFQEGRAVAAAVRAEISVLIEDFKGPGGYLETLDGIIEYLSGLTRAVNADDMLEISVAQNPFQVFDAYCGKIGLLGDAIEAVVATYGHAKSAAADLSFLPERHRRLPLTQEQLVAFHRSMRATFTKAVMCGELAITQLKQQEARRFPSWRKRPAPA